MADSTQPTETVLFDRNAVAAQPVAPQPVATQSTPVTNQPAQFANQALPVATGDNYQVQTPELSVDSNNLTSSQPYINNETNQPINAPVVEQSTYVESNSETEIPISDSSKNLEETSTTDLDSNAISTSEDVTGFNQDSSEVTVLHQPVSLLIVRLISLTIFYYLILRLLHSIAVKLLELFPTLAPNYPVNDFVGSPLFFWGSILFLLIVIGVILRWWTIFFQISNTEVVANSGIIIKQAKVLKRIGISVRQIEIKRNLLGMLLNYVTIEIGSEVMGGVSMTISDRAADLQMMTEALKPGEVLQTKKLF